MTNADVFIQILSEASGRPKEETKDLATAFFSMFGRRFKLDEEIPDDQAQELLAQLRQELPVIRAQLIRQGLIANPSGHQGSA